MKYLNMLLAKESSDLMNDGGTPEAMVEPTMSTDGKTVDIPEGDAGETFIEAEADSKVSQIQSEVLADDIETIEACKEALTETGANMAAVRLAHKQLMQLSSRYNYPMVVPGKESFHGSLSETDAVAKHLAKHATALQGDLRIAQEGIFQRMRIAMKDTFTRRKSYFSQLNKVMERAEKLSGSKAGEGTYKKESYIAAFTDGNKSVLGGSGLGKSIDDCVMALKHFEGTFKEIEAVTKLLRKGGLDDDFDFAKVVGNLKKIGTGEYVIGGNFGVGGKHAVIKINAPGDKTPAAFFESMRRAEFIDRPVWDEKHLKTKTLPSLSADEVLKHCKDMENAATKIWGAFDDFDDILEHYHLEVEADRNKLEGGDGLLRVILGGVGAYLRHKERAKDVGGLTLGKARDSYFHFAHNMAYYTANVYKRNFRAYQALLDYYSWCLSHQAKS